MHCYRLLVIYLELAERILKNSITDLLIPFLEIYIIEINQDVLKNIGTECLLNQWSLWHKTKNIFHAHL